MGRSLPSPIERVFGGQAVRQALAAAQLTVDEAYAPHSLHAYFLRGGAVDVPIRYDVDRVRDGRGFCNRLVTASQDGKPILTLSASFHRGDRGPSHEIGRPVGPGPDEVKVEWGGTLRGGGMIEQQFPNWQLRPYLVHPEGGVETRMLWMRCTDALPEDARFHQKALAYISDLGLLSAAFLPNPETPAGLASLDHALWFLRPFRVDEWLLYEQTSPSSQDGRGLNFGRIWDLEGHLVASVAQEGLMRVVEPGQSI
ncbi:acyl-CoA thioesterase [Enemella dayhoffiae]|uniref:acyl-CoA thioesterase n=1 Tax=Enemella dayhoffiae TaxID=2016507 RepID=UPI001596174E|nr:acyl-CoA thioesterase domain-containing protein [Enemella dayhoffiae]